MNSKTPINVDLIQSLWGVQACAKGAGRLGLSAALWDGRSNTSAYEIRRPSCDQTHVVSIWIKGEVTSELYLDDRLCFADVRRRGSFQLARAGESVRAVLSKRSGNCLDLYLPVSLLQHCVETEFEKARSSLELLPLGLQHDSIVTTIGDAVFAELSSPDASSRIALDSASLSLGVTLIRRFSNLKGQMRPPETGLADWQKFRAINRLGDEIESNVSLSDLASEVGLSPFHFARAFKQSTGMAPHQYQIHLRLERARTLLRSTTLMITEIARNVGYDDVGYFARLFRRRFGVSPNEFRRGRD